jgi:3-hydroxyacyl-[acyl-carrier-protein] dehydratase
MRWIWIDRFETFESGKRAVAVKNVTLAEEHLHDHVPGFAVMPASLMIEGMAQTGGILLGEKHDFKHIVILAKVPKVTFHGHVVPGDSIRYEATLVDDRPEGGSVEVTARVGDKTVAEAEIMFAHIDQSDPQFGRIDQKNFVFNSGLMGVFEVGKA